MTSKRTLCPAITLALTALTAPVANAQLIEPPVDAYEVNLVGLAAGVAPDYSGSSHNTGAVAPIFRYQFKDSKRYFTWLGPTGYLNLIDSATWRAGPMLNYRGKRDHDVDDSIVKQMDEIDSTVEGGVFLQYNLSLSSVKMHQLVFSGDVAGSGKGTVGHLRMMYWQPFSPTIIGQIGLGTTFSNDKFSETYYGVISAHDVALFPSLRGQQYKPGGGLVGVNIPFGVSFLVGENKKYLLSVGGRYEALQSDAKDSPVVQRGKSDQWIGGVGLSYLF